MRIFLFIISYLTLINCSFDTKSGIWKNPNYQTDNIDPLKEFETVISTKNEFAEKININKNFRFNLPNQISGLNWNEIFYNRNNNLDNFKFFGENKLKFKSKKLTKFKASKNIFYSNGNVILSDLRGNIIVFSVKYNKIVNNFNFYKKKFKNTNIQLNLIIEGDIIYVTDNIGYLYAYNIKKNKIIWAKNHKIPFRSNLKILKNELIAADQNNNLYHFDKNNGDTISAIPTEESVIKNLFVNNLSVANDNIIYLNTFGSVYMIINNKISWFLNLNRSTDLNPSNLFLGSPVVNLNDKIIVSSSDSLYVLNALNGSIIHKKNFSSSIRPIILNNYLFLLTRNNFLISMELQTGKILYSYDLNEKIAAYLNSKKKKAEFKSFYVAGNKIYVFLKNSYYLKLDIFGKIEKINKLPSDIFTDPIFINDTIFYLNKKNNLLIVN